MLQTARHSRWHFFFTFGDGKCTAKFCLPQSTKKRSLSVWPYDNTGKQQCTAGFFAGSTICICARSHTLFLLMEINTCWKPLTNKKFTNRVWNAPSLMKYNNNRQATGWRKSAFWLKQGTPFALRYSYLPPVLGLLHLDLLPLLSFTGCRVRIPPFCLQHWRLTCKHLPRFLYSDSMDDPAHF